MKNKKKHKIGVLVFPAGEVNSIEIHDALSTCVNIQLWGASSVERHGSYVFQNYISGLPMIQDSGFIESLNRVIQERNIDVVFPTHDTVVEFLTEHSKEIGAKIIASSCDTAKICRDKKLTFDCFADCEFCPQLYSSLEHFPVFVKPRLGQGAVGAKRLFSKKDVPPNMDWESNVVCEYLPGKEYTVDCFTDGSGNLRAILPRSRQRIFAGISANGTNEQLTDEIRSIAETINSRLDFLGLWYFQIKEAYDGRMKLLEISTRCAGTMCLSRAQGINLPLLSVYAAMDYEVSIFRNPCKVMVDRSMISRYRLDYEYDHVYIDLDDTILIDGKAHLPAVWFLYQCANNGTPITLITRHAATHEDSTETALERGHIPQTLFSRICELSSDDEKADYIQSGHPIFIDNAFVERKAVHDRLGIPVFDVDGFEVLMDWRR